ncbi:MAG: DUF423 domain-containing protein [Puniceicoccaceae bacterium]
MKNRLRTAGVLGFLGVALGAFGAHGLEEVLARSGRRDIWETAVFYHLVHVPVLLWLAVHGRLARGLNPAFWVMTAGICIFGGTLYAIGLGAPSWLGAITPIGGVSLLVGWGWIVKCALAVEAGLIPGEDRSREN